MTTPTPPALPQHVVHELIGCGGSADVWRGDGPDGPVAIKVYRTGDAAAGRSEWRTMRAHAGAHVMPVLDLLTDDHGRSCLTMPYLAGGTLHDIVVGRGGLTVGECVTAIAPIARALGALHERGVVHGDVTARNILLDADGRPVLADLGASRVIAEAGEAAWVSAGFVAPEVLDAEAPTSAADVFSLGAVLWFCCTGEPPEVAALRPHLGDIQSGLPADVIELIGACLAQTPGARPHAVDVASRLTDIEQARPIPISVREVIETPGAIAVVEPASITRRLRDEAQRRQSEQPRTQARSASRHAHARRRDSSASAWSRGRVTFLLAGTGAGFAVLAVAGLMPLHGRSVDHVVGVSSGPSGGETEHAKMDRSTPRADLSAAGVTQAASPTQDGGEGGRSGTSAPTTAEIGSLLACRAAAWNQQAARRLAGCLVKDSGAWRQDTAALSRAATGGVRYDSIAYAVRSVKAAGNGTAAACPPEARCLDTTVHTSQFTVTERGIPVRHEARDDVVHLQLRRVEGAWRISEWAVG